MHHLVSAIIKQLEAELATAIRANEEAHSSATHSENIATNRYDTLALEAAYLAHGQSMRIADLQSSIALYRHFKWPHFDQNSLIQVGALVSLVNNEDAIQCLFIGPSSGGLRILGEPNNIQILTPSAPLAKALLNKTVDDEIELKIKGQSQHFTITDIQSVQQQS